MSGKALFRRRKARSPFAGKTPEEVHREQGEALRKADAEMHERTGTKHLQPGHKE
jgi:hypothetical protein